jgi:hypothetical protein
MYGYTQGWSFDYSIGYGTYQLDDVKHILSSDSYGLEKTDDFPGHITHTFALGCIIERHHFGSNFSYLTTGGRLHRADYSGFYRVDVIMNGYRLGGFYKYYLNTGFSPLHIYLQMSQGVLFTNLRMEEEVHIYSESAEESSILKGVGMYIEPTLGLTCRLTDWLHFSLGGGYEADAWGTLKFSGQKTWMKAHWNGFRLYGGLTFILHRKNLSTQ